MPNIFRSRKAPTYTPPTGPVTMDRQQFKTVLRTRPAFRKYAVAVGTNAATAALDHMFDEQLRSVQPGGSWTFGATFPGNGATTLRFADQQGAGTLLDALDMIVGFEIDKIDDRRAYIAGLKAKANAGQLSARLAGSAELEANYYVAPPPRVAAPGAPPIPAKPVDYEKGGAWLKHGVTGSTVAFSQMLLRLRKRDGSFPLGSDDGALRAAWRQLVLGAPAYRGWNNTASQQKYPSDTGGTKLLNEILADLSNAVMPGIGQNAWYDLALYVYGSIMCAQPFTDGNKRACRLAYVLVLLSGGVPFIAPNAAFGGELADMM